MPPFRRFKGGPGEAVWGLNICRILLRRNEDSYWVPFPREWSTSGFARSPAHEIPRPRASTSDMRLVMGAQGSTGDPPGHSAPAIVQWPSAQGRVLFRANVEVDG